ncbi:MAG: amino acid ABC transporter substrate-binding protein [Pseudomonadales bacterium]
MSRQLARVLQALLLASAVIAWTPFATAAPDQRPIRIGVTTSQTGDLAEFSNLMLRGMQMWVADVNDRGALLGRRVELVVRDDGSSDTAASAAYQELLAQGVDLFVSPYSSDMTLAAKASLGNADYAMISVASAPEIWVGANTPRVFGLYTPADENMRPLLAAAQSQGLRTVAIAYQNSNFPAAVAAGAAAMAADYGLSLVANERYDSQASMNTAISRIKNLDPDLVVVGSYLRDAIEFTNAAAAAELVPRLIGFSGGPALRDYGTEVGLQRADGVLSSVQWMRSVRFPGAFDFGFRYRQQFGIYPSYDAAGGYAALQVLEAAVRLADSAEPTAIREQLQNMKFRSILGHYRVDASGRQTAKSTYLVQWQDGHISLVYPPHLARWEIRAPFSGW